MGEPLLWRDDEVCNRRTESLRVTKMIALKPTNSRLLLFGNFTHSVHQQCIVAPPNAIISLVFIMILHTSSVLSVQLDVADIITRDNQTVRVQSSIGSPKIFSPGEETVSLFDEITPYSNSTSPDKPDLISSRSSRLLKMTNIARSFKFTSTAVAPNSGPDEVTALLAIKKSLGDTYGILASWTYKNRNNDSSHCRTWVGVTCNSLQQVVGINLTGGMQADNFTDILQGTISPAFGSLKQLVVLDLSNNFLQGGIPSELGNLPRLKVLWLFYNNLTGSIPISLRYCTSLQSLNLSCNGFLGSIPISLGYCTSLQSLDLSYNGFSGSIPASLRNYSSLQQLILSNNGFTGSIVNIMVSLGNCSLLEKLDLSNNQFSGIIPLELGNCQSLMYLDLSVNSLNGSIPSTFGGLKQLQSLILRASQGLIGIIPPELGNCQNLVYLDLTFNSLNGSIPSTFGALKQLQSLKLGEVGLTGNIPPSLGYCQNLTYLDLSSNGLSGSIPSTFGGLNKLQTLNLEANQLVGAIPTTIGNYSQLQEFLIAYNNISGVIPSTLGDCSQLLGLDLSWNLLSGDIPPSLGNLQNLLTLQLCNNYLTGTIPATLSNLMHLQHLCLSTNNLTGVIPATLGSLNELQEMDLSNNDFDIDKNAIPPSFCNLGNLTSLKLSRSFLSGSIPPCLGQISFVTLDLSFNNLTGPIPPLSNPKPPIPIIIDPILPSQTVILSNNHLTGRIPNEFANLTEIEYLDLGGNHLSGTIPGFISQWQMLGQLDLSSNMFTGEFPLVQPKNYSSFPYQLVQFLDISDNNLNNSISFLLSNLYSAWGIGLETLRIGQNFFHGPLQLDFTLYTSLKYFSATGNQITGPIPPYFGAKNSSIVLIDLSRNQLTGVIASGLEPQVAASTLSALRVLTLAHNNLTGPIPLWITRLKSLQVLDLSFNNLTGSIPSDLHSLLGYKVISSNLSGANEFTLVQSVNFTSQKYTYILLTTTYMDLSSNALTGDIPLGIVQLSGLLYLYLSNNNLTGNIPTALGNLTQLERLDLSRNNLTGEIPSTLTTLSYLQIFNVSFNNLSGPIPVGGQFAGFSNASYLPGNDGLCGDVIHRLCNSTPHPPEPHVLEKDISFEDVIFLPGFLIGVAVGFSSVAFILLYWRRGQDLFSSTVRHNKTLKQRYGVFKRPR